MKYNGATKKAPYCDCMIPEPHSYCREHDASLNCPVPDCEFIWPHPPREHFYDCGCWYFNAGQFALCTKHAAAGGDGDTGAPAEVR